ncbi:hypothetical protein SEUBUCD646_0J02840 [Saccharomyces eubayanus]|uniref:Uncharacterized protein n=1 Tax=Saccharomyces eubayanus TaxID=1080349 RepID=A0ABN8VCM9_SACEU|nr:hypothetical protein SEUBUCD650_0J02830 [Saccharomyces eubayanus]CAI1541036.1 hypothetical protein SEUBUCD646_0J02840 [Saccharomyces eubayanus]
MQAAIHRKLNTALEDDVPLLFPFEQQQQQQQQPDFYYDAATNQQDHPSFSFGSTISPRSWHFEKSDNDSNIPSSQLQHLVHTQPIHLINPQILFNEEFLNLENIASQPRSKENRSINGNETETATEKQKRDSKSTKSSSLSSLFSNDDTASTYYSSYNNNNIFQKTDKKNDDVDMIDTMKFETNTNLQKDIKIFQEIFDFNEFAYAQDFYPHSTNYTYSKPSNVHNSITTKNIDSYYQHQYQNLPHIENMHSINNRHYNNNKSVNYNNSSLLHNNNNNSASNASHSMYEAEPFIDEPQVPSCYYPLEISLDIDRTPAQKLNSEELEFVKRLNAKLSRYAAAYSVSASNDQDYYDKVRFQEISYKFSKTYS